MNHLSDKQIIDFIDRSLSEKELQETDLHLKSCPDCMRSFLAHEKVIAELSGTGHFILSGGFSYSVLKSLNILDEKKKTPIFLKLIIGFFSVVLAVSIGLAVFLAAGVAKGKEKQFLFNLNFTEYLHNITSFISSQNTFLLVSISLLVILFFMSEISSSRFSLKKK